VDLEISHGSFVMLGETRMNVKRRSRAFSLVELVIVIVIIAVIAAIAIPRLTSGASRSGDAALRKSLNALRTAIDTYAAEHGGVFPAAVADGLGNNANTFAGFENQLTHFSAGDGSVSLTKDSAHPFGPYLQRMPPIPVGPNRGDSTVAFDSINSPPLVTAGSEGWVYNSSTGQILANTDAPNEEGTRTYDEY